MHDMHYMDRYRTRLQKDSTLLADLLTVVIPRLDGSNSETIPHVERESPLAKLARRLGLIGPAIQRRPIVGIPVPNFENEDTNWPLMITRLSLDGRPALSSQSPIESGTYRKYDPWDFTLLILAENRWVDLETYEERFLALYGKIASFLPENHVLYIKFLAMCKERDDTKKAREDATKRSVSSGERAKAMTA